MRVLQPRLLGHIWPDLNLLPESNNKFFSPDKEYDYQIEFVTNTDGKVIKTYFIYIGLKVEAKKM